MMARGLFHVCLFSGWYEGWKKWSQKTLSDLKWKSMKLKQSKLKKLLLLSFFMLRKWRKWKAYDDDYVFHNFLLFLGNIYPLSKNMKISILHNMMEICELKECYKRLCGQNVRKNPNHFFFILTISKKKFFKQNKYRSRCPKDILSVCMWMFVHWSLWACSLEKTFLFWKDFAMFPLFLQLPEERS